MYLYAYSHILIRFARNMCPPTNKQATAISTNIKRIPIIMAIKLCDQVR